MSEYEVNGEIESTSLMNIDHGPELCIMVRGDGWRQGYQLLLGSRAEWAPGIFAIMAKLGVARWEDLPGTPVRVRRGEDGLLDQIGHFFRNSWFDREAWKPGDSMDPSR